MNRPTQLLLLLVGGVLALPIMAIIAILVYLDVGSPILFRQTRIGLHDKPFVLHKFRTMRTGEGADAERLTAFGRWLRSTSLDELPSLWNVARGDMSLVGPRPLLPEYLPLYNERQRRRHEVRPGITGWAQINGRNALSWPDRLALDVWYVEHRSFGLDCRILWRTCIQVIRRDGIAQPGHATMEPFRGDDV